MIYRLLYNLLIHLGLPLALLALYKPKKASPASRGALGRASGTIAADRTGEAPSGSMR